MTVEHHVRLRGVLAIVCVFLLAAPAAARAEPKPTAKQLRAQLARLQARFDAVVAGYNANQEKLRTARKRQESAQVRLRAAQRDYAAAQRLAGQIASLSYQNPPLEMSLLGTADQHAAIHAATILRYQADEKTEALGSVAPARDAYRQARDAAARVTGELTRSARQLREERQEVEQLIATIRGKLDQLLVAPGFRRSDGTWVPEIPGGADNITPRMRLVRDQVKRRFILPAVGCYRSLQDGGEHPQGRACDFMITRGGSWPSAGQRDEGDRLAAWAIANARRLGVKYVIYRRRIWQGSGWSSMSDRGGITQNHQDHVHVSMY
ncbi:coiled-coil domain-containing protein [Nonomuraea typhae]|uniref:coiled-coil domain-containing protein n=1 Tax=Nonomuraea typhae TaxID=2603600 RepID=UPI0012F73775|nr:hypothetical protein [Nonomuraea typhae]